MTNWGRWQWCVVGLTAGSFAFGAAGCADEDEPDVVALDGSADARRDVSVNPDVSVDARPDTAQPDRQDSGAPEARVDASEAGTNTCPGATDAALDDALVAAGRALVESNRCANCHQDEPPDAGLILSGRDMNDAGIFPKNLTPDPQTGLGCWTDTQIANAILNGFGMADRELCTRMPRFGNRIDAGGAAQIAAFLRSLPAVQKTIPVTVCPPVPPPPDAGSDAREAGADARETGGPETGPDAGPDVATPPDAGPDTPPPDAGTDSNEPDTGLDALDDAVLGDAELDGADAGAD